LTVKITLKMSFHHWRNWGRPAKHEFLWLRQSFHGETLSAPAVTDVVVFCNAIALLLMCWHQVMSPDARQSLPSESVAGVARRAIDELQVLLKSPHVQIVALILESLIQDATGMAIHDPAYLCAARALYDQYEGVLIADEIAVCCASTGTFFAVEQSALRGQPRILPDLVCLSESIGGSYLLLSLVLPRDRIYEAFLDDDVATGFLHSHSDTGNVLACRMALAVLDCFEQDGVLARNRKQAATFTAALTTLRTDTRIVHFRQIGIIWAFDVCEHLTRARFAERIHLAEARTNC
jgi:adenosylmethionine-8-amino-7-oxononanoate aminotransferase